MPQRIPEKVRRAIAEELRAAEFRAGEFLTVLAKKYCVGRFTVQQISVRAKREMGRG